MDDQHPHRRKEARYGLHEFELKGVSAPLAGSEEHNVMVLDMSHGGIGLIAEKPFYVRDFHIFSLESPQFLVVPCRVAWCVQEGERAYRIGLKAADPCEDGLRELLDQLLQKPSL